MSEHPTTYAPMTPADVAEVAAALDDPDRPKVEVVARSEP